MFGHILNCISAQSYDIWLSLPFVIIIFEYVQFNGLYSAT